MSIRYGVPYKTLDDAPLVVSEYALSRRAYLEGGISEGLRHQIREGLNYPRSLEAYFLLFCHRQSF